LVMFFGWLKDDASQLLKGAKILKYSWSTYAKKQKTTQIVLNEWE
jgi:hypothetical protein